MTTSICYSIGPFNAGLIFLKQTANPRRTEPEILDFIVKARDRFFDALALEVDPLRNR
jgi:hypothetical protein